ncbi:MAG: LptF/LptG family permease [Mariniblastus sp.]|nr:LptF/LptG family permease [Mariniblastus sp.]
MNLITRHVVGELTKIFLLSVCTMTLLMVMVFLVQEAWQESLTPATILELIPYTIPTALCFAIPGTVLFAVCIVYGRMSGANEIVAIKSLGLSPNKVIFPGLAIAVVLSLFTVYLNDLAVSWGRTGIYRVILNSSSKTIYSVLGSQGSFSKGPLSIWVDGVSGDTLLRPHIERHDENENNRIVIRAEKAQIHVNTERNALVFRLQNGWIEQGDDLRLYIDTKDIDLPLGDVTKKTGSGRSPSNLPLRDMKAELKSQNQLVEEQQKQLALHAAFQMVGGDVIGITQPKWNSAIQELEQRVYRKHRLETEPWRRWANGFSCLCFIIVGAPLAIYMRKSDFWTIFGVCFIPILLAYYPLLMFGVEKAKSGDLPPFCVWIGNLVMVGIGSWLIRRVSRT